IATNYCVRFGHSLWSAISVAKAQEVKTSGPSLEFRFMLHYETHIV
ncbi:unnamed protein product, partial [Heterotrigona itama]